MAPRTSKTHPLRIAEVPVGNGGGMVGITLCPGKFQLAPLSGETWKRDLAEDVRAIRDWGAAGVVSIIEQAEFEELRVSDLGQIITANHMSWFHLPVVDVSVPDDGAEAIWQSHGRSVRALLSRGFRVLFHCKGGLGRSGMMAARTLVELGWQPERAIGAVRKARPGAIQTLEQEEAVICAILPPAPPAPSRESSAIRDRAVGAMLGLAIGDALGTTLEFADRDRQKPVCDLVGGGPFGLKPGQWTDDTAMALALAESLVECGRLDERDLMDRFVSWWQDGTYSCTGRCFDIGNTTREALIQYHRTGNPVAGSTSPNAAGNGSLMRLAPVAIRYWNDRAALVDAAARQSLTTHGAPDAVDACRAYAALLADAIAGEPVSGVLAPRTFEGSPRVREIMAGSWRGKSRSEIRSSGYVIDSLEAAIWSVARTSNFRDAVVLAANLAGDADTVAAIAGQLAGALYGVSGIPADWLSKLAWSDRLVKTTEGAFSVSINA